MADSIKEIFAKNLRDQLYIHSKKQNDLAKQMNVSTGTVSEWCSGKKMPRANKIQAICNWLLIEMDDLLTDKAFSKDSTELTSYAHTIRVLGRVAAGIPIDSIEETIDQEEISDELYRTGTFFGLRIKGDSMSPRIQDGDTVIVRSQEDAESDQIVIALINEHDGVCKKLRKLENGLMLISLNPSYEPMIFSKGEIDTMPVKIIGRVVEVRGKL